MRWYALVLAGCAFQPRAVEQQSTTTTLVDDTAADFMAGQRSDVAVDPLGMLVPDAFIGGGLHARSYAAITIDSVACCIGNFCQISSEMNGISGCSNRKI